MNLKDREKPEAEPELIQELQREKELTKKQNEELQRLNGIIKKQAEETNKLKSTIISEKNNFQSDRTKERRKQKYIININIIVSIYATIVSAILAIPHWRIFAEMPEYYIKYFTWITDGLNKISLLLDAEADLFRYYFYFFATLLSIIVGVYVYRILKEIIIKIKSILNCYKSDDILQLQLGISAAITSACFILSIFAATYIPGVISVLGWWLALTLCANITYHWIYCKINY